MTDSVEAQLATLYRAGKQTFPHRAAALGEALEGIGQVHDQWYAPTVRAGSPAALVKAREINETVYHLLRRAVLSWQDMSHAVVAIADDFRATDERAADAARKVGFRLDDLPMPPMAKPPTLGELES